MPSIQSNNEQQGSFCSAGRLNLQEIRNSLEQTQRLFPEINRALTTPRDNLSQEITDHLMEAYTFIDHALANGQDLLAMGNSNQLLELNSLVLVGSNEQARRNSRSHFLHNQQHFYGTDGGIGGLMEWQKHHSRDGLWKKAAGLYIQVLSHPQLFIEGNHRTGMLLMGFLLARGGHPPFVLTPANAKVFLDHSSKIENFRKHSLSMLFHFSALRNQLADILQKYVEPQHLIARKTP